MNLKNTLFGNMVFSRLLEHGSHVWFKNRKHVLQTQICSEQPNLGCCFITQRQPVYITKNCEADYLLVFLHIIISIIENPKHLFVCFSFFSPARFQRVANGKLNFVVMHLKLLKIFHLVLNYLLEVISRSARDKENSFNLLTLLQ